MRLFILLYFIIFYSIVLYCIVLYCILFYIFAFYFFLRNLFILSSSRLISFRWISWYLLFFYYFIHSLTFIFYFSFFYSSYSLFFFSLLIISNLFLFFNVNFLKKKIFILFFLLGFLGFEKLTHIPIQKKLIDVSLLTDIEIKWLNTYHSEILRKVGPLMITDLGKKWLIESTNPLVKLWIKIYFIYKHAFESQFFNLIVVAHFLKFLNFLFRNFCV